MADITAVSVALHVINASTSAALQGATVSSVPVLGGATVQGTTDANGRVNLTLNDQTSYIVTVTKTDYRTIKCVVRVDTLGTAVSPNVLGMYPSPTRTLVNKTFGFTIKDNTATAIVGAVVNFFAAASREAQAGVRLTVQPLPNLVAGVGGSVSVIAGGYNAGGGLESDRHVVIITKDATSAGDVVISIQHDTPNTDYFITLHHVNEEV